MFHTHSIVIYIIMIEADFMIVKSSFLADINFSNLLYKIIYNTLVKKIEMNY